jgi:hypothetical protein
LEDQRAAVQIVEEEVQEGELQDGAAGAAEESGAALGGQARRSSIAARELVVATACLPALSDNARILFFLFSLLSQAISFRCGPPAHPPTYEANWMDERGPSAAHPTNR